MKIIALIPARMESSRLPNKALLDIHGLPMIIHVAKRSKYSKSVDDVIVCTDSLDILNECAKHEVDCFLTKKIHKNGTERICEVVNNIDISDNDLVIDIQGDEPLIHPETIDRLISNFKKSKFDIMLPYIESNDLGNANIVKLSTVGDEVFYMSRADIPYSFTEERKLKKHLSIIIFTIPALKKYSTFQPSELEKIEGIELMRALENRLKIGTFKESLESFSVDVFEDYQKVVRYMKNDTLNREYNFYHDF
jgi:3-deoxy-manno-octulosonate cytidylyltransferase (CMP-KDO synthetase)